MSTAAIPDSPDSTDSPLATATARKLQIQDLAPPVLTVTGDPQQSRVTNYFHRAGNRTSSTSSMGQGSGGTSQSFANTSQDSGDTSQSSTTTSQGVAAASQSIATAFCPSQDGSRPSQDAPAAGSKCHKNTSEPDKTDLDPIDDLKTHIKSHLGTSDTSQEPGGTSQSVATASQGVAAGSQSNVAGSKGFKSTSKPEKTDPDLIGDLKAHIKHHPSTSDTSQDPGGTSQRVATASQGVAVGSQSTVAGSKGLKSTSKPEKTDLDLIGDLKADIRGHTSTSEPQKTDQDKNSGREIEVAFCPSQDGFRPSQDGLRSCEPGCELASQSFAAAQRDQ